MIAKFLAALAVPALIPAMQAGVVGKAQVVDGITMEVGETVVRLYGLKAPGAEQSCRLDGEAVPCGTEARKTLETLIGGEEVKCTTKGRDNKGRTLATCTVSGINLNKAMVQSGWAVADTRETGMFAGDEAEPKSAGLGLWQENLTVRLR